jgi:hypothetical protein
MDLRSAADISTALSRVGDHLAYDRERFSIVVLGGAAINLHGIRDRPTSDVDIVAFTVDGIPGADLCKPPPALPAALERAAASVARDMGLENDWMNTGPALQWSQGMPAGLASRLRWIHFGPSDYPAIGLDVGIVDRYDLIFFKVYAAADHATRRSVHYIDLLALAPSDVELERAGEWVKSLNASPEYLRVVDDLVAYAKQDVSRR